MHKNAHQTVLQASWLNAGSYVLKTHCRGLCMRLRDRCRNNHAALRCAIEVTLW
jgi:hypothetical protein